MSKVLRALDGWKLVIGVVILVAVKVWDGLNNGHAGDAVGLLLAMFGWMPEGFDVAQAAGAVTVLIGVGHKMMKAREQAKAGVPVAQLLTDEGHTVRYIRYVQAGKKNPDDLGLEIPGTRPWPTV